MNEKGYANIDSEFCDMWEMFLIVFVRNELAMQVSKVKKMIKEKGKSIVFKTFGNKGGVAYNFMYKNRIFNVIATHLQHKQEKQDKRNNMSRELVNELRMYEI